MNKGFNELFNEYCTAKNNLSDYIENELIEIISRKGNNIALEENDVFVSLTPYADEYEEMDLIQNVYIEDNRLFVSACLEHEFNELSINEQITIYTQIKDNIHKFNN